MNLPSFSGSESFQLYFSGQEDSEGPKDNTNKN